MHFTTATDLVIRCGEVDSFRYPIIVLCLPSAWSRFATSSLDYSAYRYRHPPIHMKGNSNSESSTNTTSQSTAEKKHESPKCWTLLSNVLRAIPRRFKQSSGVIEIETHIKFTLLIFVLYITAWKLALISNFSSHLLSSKMVLRISISFVISGSVKEPVIELFRCTQSCWSLLYPASLESFNRIVYSLVFYTSRGGMISL